MRHFARVSQATPVSDNISYGDNVRIARTSETERLGIAGLIGNVYDETHPSLTNIEVIGELKSDYALNVHFDALDASYWLAPHLLEFVNHAPGTEVHVHGSPFKSVHQRDGSWKSVPVNPDGSSALATVAMPRTAVGLLLVVAAFALLSLVLGAPYLESQLPGGLPIGNALAAVGLCAAAGAAVGLSAGCTALRRLSVASLLGALAWLPVSIALAGNLDLNFHGGHGMAWLVLSVAILAAVLCALGWGLAAALLAKYRRSGSA